MPEFQPFPVRRQHQHQQMLGEPMPFSHSYDNFDKETTFDEHMFELFHPFRYGVNPGIRAAVTRFQELEKTYHRRPYKGNIL
ncbi:hypothetical protein B4U80_05646 [Leptotrombidium deliense]|uniref:Uncharacterized protein n=1 Tax=Leptotrombidium deliense TaxID=299467 RepID=A0A443S669_9ACAR|nr:hypothetical protein B4U80_05646 [Leptotrombidium deliense]